MAKILLQLIGSLSQYLQGFYTSQDFFHQQYDLGFFGTIGRLLLYFFGDNIDVHASSDDRPLQ